jgi:predicted dienelactone hydrolase
MSTRAAGLLAAAVLLVAGGATVGVLSVRWGGHPAAGADQAAASDPPTTTTIVSGQDALPGPPYPVASSTLTFVDPTRTTPARGSVTGFAGRTLRTIIRKPAGVTGPLPLVVFASGYDGAPEDYEQLLDAWAAAGYLVAAPDFPGTGSDLPGTPTESDVPQEALDISFVITQLLEEPAAQVDGTRIAVAGHSDGAVAVNDLAFDPSDRDPRIVAYVSLSGIMAPGLSGSNPAPGSLLAVAGSADIYHDYAGTQQVYAQAAMPKAFVSVPGGDHLSMYTGTSNLAQAVHAEIVRYLNLVLAPPDGDHRSEGSGQPGRPPSASELAAALTPTGTGAPYTVSVGQ